MNKIVLSIPALVIVAWSFIACDSREAVKKTEGDVMAIHDQLMPKMDDVMRLKKQLKLRIASLDSLEATGSAAATVRTDEDKQQATRLSRDLIVADSLMMGWMGQYNSDTLTKLSSEEALKYLAAQKDQITDVKTKVNTSIDQTRQFLGKK